MDEVILDGCLLGNDQILFITETESGESRVILSKGPGSGTGLDWILRPEEPIE